MLRSFTMTVSEEVLLSIGDPWSDSPEKRNGKEDNKEDNKEDKK